MEDVDVVPLTDQPHPTSQYWSICDPRAYFHRFVVLLFICFLSFGNYFCYDNPAALEDDIMRDMQLSGSQYGALYTVYAWPNVILALFGGYLMDRVFGLRWGAVLFAGIIMLGQVVLAIGALVDQFGIMVLGRFIFAIGGESLAVAQNMYAVKWFKGKELNTVFGVQLSLSRVGSTVNMYVMKPLYMALRTSGTGALGLTLLLGGGSMTALSFLCGLVLMVFDKRYDRIMISSNDQTEQSESIKLSDILRFPRTFWLLSVVCVTYYVAVFPLVAYGLVFFSSKYQLDAYQADICNSLIYLISIGASPVCGVLVDCTGRNVLWVTVSVLMTALAHGLLAFTFLTPYVPMVMIGLAYSLLAASLWPCVAYVVPARALGTAYGVMQSIQNLGLALLYLSVGAVVDWKGYLTLELYFLLWLSISLCSSLTLWFVDSSHGGVLNSSRRGRVKIDDDEEEST